MTSRTDGERDTAIGCVQALPGSRQAAPSGRSRVPGAMGNARVLRRAQRMAPGLVPNLSSKKQTPMKFTQKWIFDNAELKSAAFADWIKPSNDPVHMTSAAVALGSNQVGGAPAGYSPKVSALIGWWTACSLNELVANLCRLSSVAGLPLDRATAWAARLTNSSASGAPGLSSARSEPARSPRTKKPPPDCWRRSSECLLWTGKCLYLGLPLPH